MNLLKKFFRSRGFYRLAFPPGHFASPIPDPAEILNQHQLFDKTQAVADIALRADAQRALFSELLEIAAQAPYLGQGNFRYHFENQMLGPMDGLMLYSMLRKFQPKTVIEVGSGYSSAIMLDVNNLERENAMKLTFIEPYPDRLHSLLKEEDYQAATVIEQKIQEVDLARFEQLEANDMLFLDTSHIVKTGNDVVFWLFHILPRLQSGVLIHIHDIFWPFEYPKAWIEEQKCYTEIYLIRAFLMNNADYEIVHFNSYIQYMEKEKIEQRLPILNRTEGGSLWIRKK
jgi:predicted O-methyltransferase YrrM